MLIVGITSKLPKGLALFFWEYDNISEFEALEEANFLSQAFDIEMYVCESSPRHFHVLSFDLLPKELVKRVQKWVTFEGDYVAIDETLLWDNRGAWTCLRIGKKGLKSKPRFIKAFLNDKRLKSLPHLRLHSLYSGIPQPSPDRAKFYVNAGSVYISVYNSGIGAKPKKRRKNDRF